MTSRKRAEGLACHRFTSTTVSCDRTIDVGWLRPVADKLRSGYEPVKRAVSQDLLGILSRLITAACAELPPTQLCCRDSHRRSPSCRFRRAWTNNGMSWLSLSSSPLGRRYGETIAAPYFGIVVRDLRGSSYPGPALFSSSSRSTRLSSETAATVLRARGPAIFHQLAQINSLT